MIKKEELVKENKRLKEENELLKERTKEIVEKNVKIVADDLENKLHRNYILNVIFNVLVTISIGVFIADIIFTLIDGKRTRDMINKADTCVEINDEVYCNIKEDK